MALIAPLSITISPADLSVNAIQCFLPLKLCSEGRNSVPTSFPSNISSSVDPLLPLAIIVGTPYAAALFAASILVFIPPTVVLPTVSPAVLSISFPMRSIREISSASLLALGSLL